MYWWEFKGVGSLWALQDHQMCESYMSVSMVALIDATASKGRFKVASISYIFFNFSFHPWTLSAASLKCRWHTSMFQIPILPPGTSPPPKDFLPQRKKWTSEVQALKAFCWSLSLTGTAERDPCNLSLSSPAHSPKFVNGILLMPSVINLCLFGGWGRDPLAHNNAACVSAGHRHHTYHKVHSGSFSSCELPKKGQLGKQTKGLETGTGPPESVIKELRDTPLSSAEWSIWEQLWLQVHETLLRCKSFFGQLPLPK